MRWQSVWRERRPSESEVTSTKQRGSMEVLLASSLWRLSFDKVGPMFDDGRARSCLTDRKASLQCRGTLSRNGSPSTSLLRGLMDSTRREPSCHLPLCHISSFHFSQPQGRIDGVLLWHTNELEEMNTRGFGLILSLAYTRGFGLILSWPPGPWLGPHLFTTTLPAARDWFLLNRISLLLQSYSPLHLS